MEFYNKKQMKKLLLIFNCFLLSQLTVAQVNSFAYKEYIQKSDKMVLEQPKSNLYYDTSSLFDGKSDLTSKEATSIIQKALDKYKYIRLPNFELIISDEGLTLPSDSSIIFSSQSVLRIEENSLDRYELLRIHNVENVSIYNAKLIGERDSDKTKVGEWGHGISIRGSKNILIDGFDIREFYGDGIYIGYEKNGSSQGVSISNGIVDFNRRNGISITSVNRLLISNVVASNTFGTNPNFGLDIEPNNNKDEINNIVIKKLTTYNNLKGGVLVSLNKMVKGDGVKYTNILIEDYVDLGSMNEGFVFGKIEQSYGLKGSLVIKNIQVNENHRPIIIRDFKQSDFFIEVKEFDILKPKNKNFDNKEFERVNLNKRNIRLQR